MKIDAIENFTALNDNYIMVLTSNSKEKQAINLLINNRQQIDMKTDTHGCCIGQINGFFVVHITGTSGISEILSIGRIALKIIGSESLPSPAFIVLFGICWGNPIYVDQGDTILSSTVCSLNSSVMTGDKVIYKDQYTDSKLKLTFLNKELSEISDKIKVGPIASLETLFSSAQKRDELLQQYPSLYGGEMEAFGFISSIREVPWMIIKNVSDFADESFTRIGQVSAAASSSGLIPGIISVLVKNELLKLQFNLAPHILLINSLIGNTIKINKTQFNSDTLNDYLNDIIGPVVLYKLDNYCSGLEYQDNFSVSFCDLFLEISQNSFKHGMANKVEITFYNDCITVYDDGNDYDLHNLNGDNGGSRSWTNIRKKFIDSDQVTYTYNKKKHKFKLSKINEMLRDIKSKCTAIILPDKVNSGYLADHILDFNPECKAIYIDVSKILMTSRKMSITKDITKLIAIGKIIIISCRNNQQAEDYHYDLGPDSENLRIIIN